MALSYPMPMLARYKFHSSTHSNPDEEIHLCQECAKFESEMFPALFIRKPALRAGPGATGAQRFFKSPRSPVLLSASRVSSALPVRSP